MKCRLWHDNHSPVQSGTIRAKHFGQSGVTAFALRSFWLLDKFFGLLESFANLEPTISFIQYYIRGAKRMCGLFLFAIVCYLHSFWLLRGSPLFATLSSWVFLFPLFINSTQESADKPFVAFGDSIRKLIKFFDCGFHRTSFPPLFLAVE